MAKDSDHLAGALGAENTGGVLSGLLAEENEFDRRALWRLGSWAAGAVGAVTVAVLANQSSLGLRRDQLAAADLSRQAQQLQSLTRESQSETRRLASAIETLNGDRDRLYSRVTVLEQGLEQATGAVARQTSAPAAASGQQVAAKSSPIPIPIPSPAAVEPTPAASPAQAAAGPSPNVAPVTTTTAFVTERPRPEVPVAAPFQPQSQPVPPQPQPQSQPQTQAGAMAAALPKIVSNAPTESLTGPKSLMGPPDPAASKLIEPVKAANAASPAEKSAAPPAEKNAVPTAEKDAAPPVEKEKEVAAVAPAPANDAEASDNASSKVQRTEFAVDLGSANSVGGLRALWRGLLKVNAELVSLRPIIVVKERSTGLGMQLRLAAGPFSDAAAAAKICAALIASERGCETTVFDGQRLSMQAEETPRATTPAAAKHSPSRHGSQRRTQRVEEPVPVKSESTLSSLFGRSGK